jgi:outer membrane protein TolC
MQAKMKLLALLTGLLANGTAWAQNQFSVKQAVDYAVSHHLNVKNGEIAIENSLAKIKEIKAMGLPQVTGSIAYQNNILIQQMIVPAQTFNPMAGENDVVAVKFGVPQGGNLGVQVQQLVFDGSYLLGLKAADVYKELSEKNLNMTKVGIAENVTKAYYGVLVNNEKAKILDLNIERLDSLFKETKILNAKGFVEKLDVQRLEVSINNLKIEKEKIQKLLGLSKELLQFQMSMPITETIELTTQLNELSLEGLSPMAINEVSYADRTEYSMLQTSKRLAELNLKNTEVKKYPSVFLQGNLGANNGRQTFGDLITKKWFPSSSISLATSIPIFDGYARKYKTIQARNELRTIDNNFKLLEQGIDFQVSGANTGLKNSFKSLESYRKTMDLATEIVRVTKIKYKQGAGTNLEILNAESSLKEAQTNYLTGLYDALIAKVELDKAAGKLY